MLIPVRLHDILALTLVHYETFRQQGISVILIWIRHIKAKTHSAAKKFGAMTFFKLRFFSSKMLWRCLLFVRNRFLNDMHVLFSLEQ